MKRCTWIKLTIGAAAILCLILWALWVTDLLDSLGDVSGPISYGDHLESEVQRRLKLEKKYGALGRHYDEVAGLENKTIDEVIVEIGPPDAASAYRAWGELDLLRAPIRNHHPWCSGAMIRELRWDYGIYDLSVWFHRRGGEWVEFMNCRWSKDIVF